jgi:hypothetical protein
MNGQQIIKRYDQMDDYVGANWRNIWQEAADWCMPTNDNINRVRTPGQEKPPQRMIDSCIEANFNFASGFFSHIFPTNTVWAKFRHPSPDMMDIPAVADYFQNISRVIHGVLIGSNFAQMEFESLLAMGCFGTSVISVEPSEERVVKFRNYIVNKIRLDENYEGTIDTIAREFELDGRQAIQQFGEEVFRENNLERIILDAEQMKDTKYKFVHYIAPRSDRDVSKKDKNNKPWASYYVIREGDNPILREGGFDYKPYAVARFITGNDEVYGRGPMLMKLGTARRSNVIYRSLIVSAEQQVNNQWLVADDDVVAQKTISQRANALVLYRASSPGGKPERLESNGNVSMAKELFDMHDQEIKRMFFNHLFRPLEDYRNMTATEVSERTTSDLMTLSPFVSRYIEEKVNPTMNTVYALCQKVKGLLPDVPAELVEDPNFEIEYVGRLALATKNFEVLGAVSTMRVMAELAQQIPQLQEWADNVKPDDLTRQMWHANSSSMNALRDAGGDKADKRTVEEVRTERKEAQAKQQQIDNMAPIADATQKMSGAVDPSSVVEAMRET